MEFESNSSQRAGWDNQIIAKTLQTIHFEQKRRDLKLLTVTSAVAMAGKTTLSLTIASGLAEVYKQKVLYNDLNPQGDVLLTQKLGKYQTRDGFVQGHSYPFSIYRIKDLIIDWSKNFFDSLFIGRLLEDFKNQFDLILIDSNSTLSNIDHRLNIHAEGYVVVCSKKSLKENQELIASQLNPDTHNVIALILNG